MDYTTVKANLWSNAVSNYIRTIVAMVVGLLTFRLLFQSLSPEQFGFWALLWSVFGYGVLLDFGFGFAAQKRVAELSVNKQWDELSRVLSSILGFYAGIALLIAVVVLVGSPWIIQWFSISAENEPAFRRVLVFFFVGIGLAFPMGLFHEILRGQQRIRLANNLITTALILRLLLIGAAVHFGWSFLTIMVIALVMALAPDVLAAFFALRAMPAVRLHPRLMSGAAMRHTAAFSVFAYISTATNIVLGKTDQLVIGATLGVGSIALYQAGAKVAEVFSQFTKQIQDTLSPAAAHLHAQQDHAALRDLTLRSLRWSIIIATPLYLLCAFHLDTLLSLLTGERVISSTMSLVGQLLLAWFYTTLLTHSVSKRVFMMTGHHRRLMKLGLAEAIANLLLSIGLVLIFRHVAAIAIGSLIPTLTLGWFFLWPWMAREIGMSSFGLVKETLLPVILACLPMALFLAIMQHPAFATPNPIIGTLLKSSLATLLGLISLHRWVMTPAERTFLFNRLPRFIRRPSSPQLAPIA